MISKAHSPSPLEESLRLSPQFLIPRACLPLAFLDPGGALGDLQGSRLFCARIPALEEDSLSDRQSILPTILIAASDASASLYAVERVRCGTFALCRLGAWVTLKELQRLKLECCPQPKTTSTQRAGSPGTEWWQASAIRADLNHDRSQLQKQKQKQVRRESFRLCLKSPLPTTMATSPVDEVARGEAPDEATVELHDKPNDPLPEHLTQDPDETLMMIRTQYQETLYMSQVRTHWLFFIWFKLC